MRGTYRLEQIEQVVVTAKQMHEIEARVFAAGMPVAALMEKVGGLIAERIQSLYPVTEYSKIDILVGPGHNGGDALVIARELYFQGYQIRLYRPLSKAKDLTAEHARYAASLGIPVADGIEQLQDCDLLIDGLFGYGQERAIESPIKEVIEQINQWSLPVVSIDLPSGLHTDTGEALGIAVKADRTFCIGLWKLGLLQDRALEFVGRAELVDIDLPLADALAVTGEPVPIQRITKSTALAHLPLPRPLSTYKYKMGSMLMICGSHQYSGGAILTALGARATGVGMLYIAVPESLQMLMSDHLPEALILSCPETDLGAIAQLPKGKDDLSSYDVVACGPGLTRDAKPIVQQVLESDRPLVLDADGLNILAELGTVPTLSQRQAPTVLTPHTGEFKRLFPELSEKMESHRVEMVRTAAQQTGAVVLLKGARTTIANPQGKVAINPESTPALARGGSGDVLTGLIGGLLSQTLQQIPIASVVQTAAWWHAHAGRLAASERTELGVDAYTLTQFLIPALKANLEKD